MACVEWLGSLKFARLSIQVWEFEHYKLRLRGNSTRAGASEVRVDKNTTEGGREGDGNVTSGAPRLGVDGVMLGHITGNQV